MNDYFDLVSQIKEEVNCAIIAFSYYNPLMQYGHRFYQRFKNAGGDGVLCVDNPVDQATLMVKHCQENELDIIPLVTRESKQNRQQTLARYATSLIYYVNRLGITGIPKNQNKLDLNSAKQLRRSAKKFVACGFGVHTKAHVDQIHAIADAAVVGSYLVEGASYSIDALEDRLIHLGLTYTNATVPEFNRQLT